MTAYLGPTHPVRLALQDAGCTFVCIMRYPDATRYTGTATLSLNRSPLFEAETPLEVAQKIAAHLGFELELREVASAGA